MTDAIAKLRREGYKQDFTLEELNHLEPHQFRDMYSIDQTLRFDEWSDPEDQSALYAISSRDGRRRGLLINGYGVYSDPHVDDLLEQADTKH